MNPFVDPVALIASLVLGYLCGSIPFGLLLTRWHTGRDIRQFGSGNIGATNVLRSGHKGIAIVTLLADAGKAALACFVTSAIFSPDFGAIAGMAAIIGHCFPLWLGFRGGKGVATGMGFLFAVMWKTAIIAGLVWLVTAWLFRYSSLAAIIGMGLLLPLWALLAGESSDKIGMAMILGLFILGRHLANISRLFSGTETRIGQKLSPMDKS